MRKLVIVATVLSAAAVAWGGDWEGDLLDIGNKVEGTVGVTYDTMYVWRGFRIFDNKSAVHFLGDLAIADTGFGVSAFGHRANSSGRCSGSLQVGDRDEPARSARSRTRQRQKKGRKGQACAASVP